MSLAGCNKGKTEHFIFLCIFFGLDLLEHVGQFLQLVFVMVPSQVQDFLEDKGIPKDIRLRQLELPNRFIDPNIA